MPKVCKMQESRPMCEPAMRTLLQKGTAFLEENHIGEAQLDAWLLLEYVTGKNRTYYLAHMDEAVPREQERQYWELLKRRGQHIPLQHLTHQAFFMGYEFYVNENVLIPRQDTEILAEMALNCLKGMEKPRLLDMCTGSGCILLSILLEKPKATGVGADVSEEALEVAKYNSERLGVGLRAELVQSNLFEAAFFAKTSGKQEEKYDILISNPPYIPTEQIELLMEEVRFHDPRQALDGKEDGLYFYREITKHAGEYLKSGGWLLYEIGYDQGEAVKELLEKAGFIHAEIKKDLAGLDRVVCGQKPLTL